MGRGKVIRIDPDGWLIQEDGSHRWTKVAADERIRSLRVETEPMTLGYLRRFLAMHEGAPDDIPVTVAVPVCFNCDDQDYHFEEGHPEAHLANTLQAVSACDVMFTGYEGHSDDWHFRRRVRPRSP